jgi:hypothetical protein
MMAKITTDQKREISNWQPWMIYTWTKAMLQAWFDTHGSFALYNGEMWEPVSRNLGVGRYEVRFRKYNRSM